MIVFVSGSSKLKKLTEEMKKCLDEHVSKNASFIVGDCYGADELAQKYLKSKRLRRRHSLHVYRNFTSKTLFLRQVCFTMV